MVNSCYFSGESGVRCDLEETDHVFIVRTSGGSADALLAAALEPDVLKNHILPFDSFPEACVYLYKCVGVPDPALLREEVKEKVRALDHPRLRYIGTVLKFAGAGIYQIYTGNLFVKFYDSIGQPQIKAILTEAGLEIKSPLSFATNAYFAEPTVAAGREIFELSQQILAYPEVEYCHPELVVKNRSAFAEAVLSADSDNDSDLNWIFRKTGVFKAWNTTKGKGVKIAVIDDGLDFDHPAFAGTDRIVFPRDMLDKDQRRLPLHQFDEKHGTACASIACSGDLDSLGVAPEANLIPIRVTGLGSVLQSEAFYWAVQNGADVISCSWGPPDGSIFSDEDDDFVFPLPDHTRLAFDHAARHGRGGKGTVIVFAAGNGREPVKNDSYAANEAVLAVGSSNKIDLPTVYSDYGTPLLCCFPSGEYEVISLTEIKRLYGVKVADRIGAAGYSPNDYYDSFDGTSASCPGVAGVVALMLSANPALTLADVKEIIKLSCQKIGTPGEYADGYSERYGYGLLRADRAVKNALKFNLLTKTLTMETSKNGSPALSLHIGINVVDKAYYKGYVPPLAGCVRDMNTMQDLAVSLGYEPTTLANEQATREAIKERIITLGKQVRPGGILLVTYAGHGAPIPDTDDSDEEDDNNDESWVSYNGFLLDDELNECYATIPAGIRVVVVSDSCHSATVTRFVGLDVAIRSIDLASVKNILAANDQSVSSLRSASRAATPTEPKAFVKLLSACEDDQYAKETGGAGVFTTRLLEIFKTLKEAGSKATYREFIDAVNKRMSDFDQIPGIFNTGPRSVAFDGQFPFSTTSLDGAPVSTATTQDAPKPGNTPKPTDPSAEIRQESILVVKSKKAYVKVPKKTDSRAVAPAVTEMKITNGAIVANGLAGETDWDKAYNLMLANVGNDLEYVEPDMVSNVFIDPSLIANPEQRALDETGYLKNYPQPQSSPGFNAFVWHLDDRHSQLKSANAQVFPEMLYDGKPDPAKRMVKIAHIDTGYLPQHPALPENLDPAAVTFSQRGSSEGAEDYDVVLYPQEKQGHGNATLAILAGGKLSFDDTLGEYQGYFGAIPFARVLSLKVSETVILLSGRNFAAAVDYAIEQGCDVITMSMAGLPSKVMAEAVNKAYEAGVVLVSAAGNSFVKGFETALPKTTLYPARYDRTIAAVGAACDQRPYLFDIHNPAVRSAGGEFMQMNFGPNPALATTLAAYTPNLTWFDGEYESTGGRNQGFVKSGGGTSSATPQIAAAAALYIQQYRTDLDRIAGNDKWKKVELVRAALFEAADKTGAYQSYYGNGILKAKDTLDKKPAQFENSIQKTPEAEGGGGLFKRLFRLFTGRSAFGETPEGWNDKIGEMMSTEIMQLLHREEKLHPYLDQINLEGGVDALDQVADLDDLVQKIQNSKNASLFLKQRLVSPYNERGFIPSDADFSNHVIPTDSGNIYLRSAGLQWEVRNVKTNQPCQLTEGVEYHEMEIEIGGVSARGIEPALSITDDFAENGREAVLLLERQVDGETLLEWKLKGPSPAVADAGKRGLFVGADRVEGDQFFIDLGRVIEGTDRGIFGKTTKLIVKIFSWLKPKKANLPVADLLAQLGDANYQLLAYDLDTADPSGKAWVDAETVPEIFTKITDDKLPLLLLLPGLFSTVEKGFDEFLANAEVVKVLKKKYGRYVLGFDMPTLVQGIEDNGKKLDEILTKAKLTHKPCSVIGRSRGELVARYLFEDLWMNKNGQPTAKAPLVLHKLVFTGTPNQGTMIASHENWSNLINIVTNVANLTLGTVVPVLPKVTAVIKGILNQVVLLPGINDQEETSEFLKKLNGISIPRDNYFVVTSNFEPNGLLKKLFDQNIIDRVIFKNQLNDSIAPVKGAVFKNDDSKITLNANQFHIGGDADRVSHFTYLRPENKVVLDKILNWL